MPDVMMGGEAIAKTLSALGVDTVFGLMGRMNLRILTAITELYNARYFAARHESAAVAMAIGYGRASGKLGVATVTWGPGVSNSVTALIEAHKARMPLLLLAGDALPDGVRDNQFVDQSALFGALGILVVRIDSAESLVVNIATAVRRAVAERRPVVLSVPLEIQVRAVDADLSLLPPTLRPAPLQPAAAAVEQMADLVATSARPAVIAGRGAVDSGADDALRLLGDQTGALLATSLDATGIFTGHPRYIGTAGVHSSPLAVQLLRQSDTVLAFGVSLNHFGTRAGHLFAPDVQIVRCDIDEVALARPRATLAVLGDAAATAEALTAELSVRGHQRIGWAGCAEVQEIAAYRREHAFCDESGGGFVDTRSVMVQLDRQLPRDRAVVPETGHACGYALDYLPCYLPRSSINVIDFQAIGLGLAVAAGAAVARPDRITVAVIGDGGVLMSAGELETLARYRLPVLVLVLNDSAYGAEARELEQMGKPVDMACFPETNFVAFGAVHGFTGISVRKLADLALLNAWIGAPDGPAIADCRIDVRRAADWFTEMIGSSDAYLRHPRPGF
jgi:thiamine pyrophosphate-dependent acetolactate synthase large subunit-like protein